MRVGDFFQGFVVFGSSHGAVSSEKVVCHSFTSKHLSSLSQAKSRGSGGLRERKEEKENAHRTTTRQILRH